MSRFLSIANGSVIVSDEARNGVGNSPDLLSVYSPSLCVPVVSLATTLSHDDRQFGPRCPFEQSVRRTRRVVESLDARKLRKETYDLIRFLELPLYPPKDCIPLLYDASTMNQSMYAENQGNATNLLSISKRLLRACLQFPAQANRDP